MSEKNHLATMNKLIVVATIILNAVGDIQDPKKDTVLRFTTGDASYHGGVIPDIHTFGGSYTQYKSKEKNGWLSPNSTQRIELELGSTVAQYIQLNGKKDGICIATLGYKVYQIFPYHGAFPGDVWGMCGGFLNDVTNIRAGGEPIKCGYLSQKGGTPDQVRFHIARFNPSELEKSKNKSANLCDSRFEGWNAKIADDFINTPFNSSKLRIFKCSEQYYLRGEDRALTACTDQSISGASLVDECHHTFCDMSTKTYYNLNDSNNALLKDSIYNNNNDKFDRDVIEETDFQNYDL